MRSSEYLNRLWQPTSVASTISLAVILIIILGCTTSVRGQDPDAPPTSAEAVDESPEGGVAALPAEGDAAPDDQAAASPSDQQAEPAVPSPSDRQADPAAERGGELLQAARQAPSTDEAKLRFNFSGTPWREVLDWLVEEADLSLRVDRYPPGSLTFVDPSRTYSPSEALDQLNRLLLDRGFALVRRGRLLIVIDLEDPSAQKYIENIAEVVTPSQLDSRGESDIVKCIFPLGAMTPEAAEQELIQMVGPGMPMTVLPSARQVVVTDTVARLKAIRTVLEDAEQAGSDVVEIPLQHRGAEEVLQLARSLLQLEEGQNSNDEIRIAVDAFGDRLYAVGNPATISLLKRVVEKADQPFAAGDGSEESEIKAPELRSYPVAVADPTTVYDVLQTLLAGLPDTRLTIDPESKAVIAFARPETHATIQATLDHLEGKGKQLEVIQLRRLEPSAALLTINKFFGKTAEGNEGPTVDGDPITGRLWVHGTPEQITKTKNLIERLEDSDSAGPLGDRIRILPFTGQDAEDTLEQVRMLWEVSGRNSQIRVVSPSASREGRRGFPQRTLRSGGNDASEENDRAEGFETETESRESQEDREARFDRLFPEASHRAAESPFHFVAQQGPAADQDDGEANADTAENLLERTGTEPAPAADQNAAASSPSDRAEPREIVITMTPQGMIIVGDDPVALAELEELMRMVSEQTSLGGSQPTVFWLKYVKASVASQLINGVLGGTDSGGGGLGDAAGSLLDELGGGMLGGLMGFGGGGGGGDSGPILTATGSVSIVPDDRLNALIVQANAVDMNLIELILEVVDREESPENVQTQARPRLIPVIYQDAEAVADIVKSVFAEKMVQPPSSGRGGGDGQPSPQDLLNALRGGGGGRGGRGGGGGGGNAQGERSEPQKITLAVDKRSNAIIVTATPQDFEQIEELVEAIDQGGMENEETVQVVQLNGAINPQVVQTALESVLGTQAKTASSNGESSSSSSSNTSSSREEPRSSSDASEIQRRIEAFRSMRSRGGGGGPPGGFGERGGTSGRGGRGGR